MQLVSGDSFILSLASHLNTFIIIPDFCLIAINEGFAVLDKLLGKCSELS